jgi:hypothetical protein
MPTPEGDDKDALIRFVQKRIAYADAALGFQLGAQTALSSLPASVGGYNDTGFATGYDSGTGLTTVAFITDVSFPDGPDLVVD